jgi:hypothetical protein
MANKAKTSTSELIPDPQVVRQRLHALAEESRLLRSLYRVARRAAASSQSQAAATVEKAVQDDR